MASISETNISDEQIDRILWAFFEDWDVGINALKSRDTKEFLSIMKKIGELLIGIESDKAMLRCQHRLELITKALIQGLPPEHVRNRNTKTRKTRTEL